MKLWGGRFKKNEDELMEDFNSSLPVDQELVEMDIAGSIAHVKMLKNSSLITAEEEQTLIQELESMLANIKDGTLKVEGNFEDVHSFIEATLTERIGDLGKKLHTARSRNDQVAVDLKMYARQQATNVIERLSELKESLEQKAEDHNHVMMPGYTHLQKAQVVTFGYHLRAYIQMFNRDQARMESAIANLNENPLGSGALAGTTHSVDRNITTDELNFRKPVDNFMDGVSDRDYVIELISGFSTIMMHLSRLSEEIILWNSQEFAFIKLDDAYATGSSIMPQKKNPDAAELIRGKTGRVYGSLMSILTTMKGLPLAYNKDMQEDKEPLFDAMETVSSSLTMMERMITTLTVNEHNMKRAIKSGFLNATEVADYLVSKGMAFREAHGVVGSLVIHAEEHNKSIEDLTLDELQSFSDLIKNDIYEYVDYDTILSRGNKQQIRSDS